MNLPTNWEDCTRTELEWLAEHGSYGQRLIANRYLAELRKIDAAKTEEHRASLRRIWPSPTGSIQ
jgi:hypothetical protein